MKAFAIIASVASAFHISTPLPVPQSRLLSSPSLLLRRASSPSPRSAPLVAKLTETDRRSWCTDVENTVGLTAVFFYAPWCMNCKAVRPKLERLQRKYADQNVKFLQANFKTETALCYSEKVFSFPTIHFYLPRIGRVARAVLTASNTDEKVKDMIDRLLDGRAALEQVSSAALSPVIQYTKLVSALESVAGTVSVAAVGSLASSGLTAQGSKKESTRLRGLVKNDEATLAEIESLFRSLDADADGQLRFAELESALSAIQPSGGAVDVLDRLGRAVDRGDTLNVDKSTFISLMVDKAVQDFAAGDDSLLSAFKALDSDGDGTVTQAQLIGVIDGFCAARPLADGCDSDAGPRNLQLAAAFDAFADEKKRLDYERFVAMVSGRREGFGVECELLDDGEGEMMQPEAAGQVVEIDEMMGERECFGEAVNADGSEDLACDAWFFGEDPFADPSKRFATSDPDKIARLRAEAEAKIQEGAKREEEMAAYLARRAAAKK